MKVKIIRNTSLDKFQQEVNNFIAGIDTFKVDDIKLSVQREFLPHTTTAEYIETYYGIIIYEE